MTLKLFTNTELPESEYHGEEYKDYLSGSELWEFLSKCPAEAVYGEKKDTPALQFGSQSHTAVLEHEIFTQKYARDFEAPEGCLMSDTAMKSWLKAHGIAGYSSKKGMELVEMVHKAEPEQKCFIDEQAKYQSEHEGKEFLKPELYDQLEAMRSTMSIYPSYQGMIDNGLIEHSIVGESELLGLPVKVRPDIADTDAHVICNYKTTNSANPDDVIRDSFKYGYFMKEYLNAIIYQEMFGEFPTIRILAQSKSAPYVCTGITLTEEQIEIGRLQFEKAFALWKACKDAGAYIDHAQGEWLEVETPQWMFNQTVN